MAEQEKSPLQREQQALQKPLGLKRPLSWILFVPILFAFLVLPLLAMQAPELFGVEPTSADEKPQTVAVENLPVNAHPSLQSTPVSSTRNTTALALDSIWNPGPLASAHANLEGDCQACHAGNFSRVKDESCLVCHSNMGLHVAEQTVPDTSFEEGRCAAATATTRARSLAEQNKHLWVPIVRLVIPTSKPWPQKLKHLRLATLRATNTRPFELLLQRGRSPAICAEFAWRPTHRLWKKPA